MLVVVGKASPNDQSGEIEYYLSDFYEMLDKQGRFVYAWNFNSDRQATEALQQNLPFKAGRPETWLYLIGEPWFSPLKMRVVDFAHSNKALYCPNQWKSYCIDGLWGINKFHPDTSYVIHVWFLIDKIEKIHPPLDVRHLEPFFPDKYRKYGRNHFGFFKVR